MKKFQLFCILLFSGFVAQSQVIRFDKTYFVTSRNCMNNFQQTNDGGYILNTDNVPTSVNSIGKGYLIKMNAYGGTQWIKSYDKANGFVKYSDGNSVYQTNDGGYIIGTALYQVSNIPYGSSLYLIKTDAAGNTLWSKTYPGMGCSFCYCVKQTSDLGYIACGFTIDTITNLSYTYLLKTDMGGNPQWGKTYAETVSGQSGIAYCVNQTADGGYILTGDSYSGAFVMKTDNAGSIQWSSNLGGSGSDILHCVKQTYDGGYIATGSCLTPFNEGITLLKFDGSGNTQWEKIYTTSTTATDEGFSVEEVPGGYVVLGILPNSQPGLMRTDASGNVLWSVNYQTGQSYFPTGLEKTTDGGYAFAYEVNTNVGGESAAVIKTDSLGMIGCRDSSILLIDSIYIHQTNPGFVAANVSLAADYVTVIIPDLVPDTFSCGTLAGIEPFLPFNSCSIFPNPTSGIFSIQMNSLNENRIEIEVYDMLGQTVMERKEENVSGNFQEQLDLSAMSDGIYFVSVKVDDSVVLTKKVVKEN